MKGETRHQYPIAGMREADIAVGSSLPVDQLLSGLSSSCRALEVAWDELNEDQWELTGIVTPGPSTMSEIVFRRLREVEVHHVDLDVGYGAADWPSIYVDGEIERSIRNLPDRADHVDLVKWLIGRGEAPSLSPW
jgi:maleylpyruvate isomerase